MQTIAIIGLGYVGLPLALEFGKKYKTIGFDISKKRIDELIAGVDKTNQIPSQDLKASTLLHLSSNSEDIAEANFFIITVPTPLDQYKNPDISFLINASKEVAKYLKKGDIVIYESTTYPTCTELDCVPVLEKNSNLIFNKDFFVGYSPERINPGDKSKHISQIKKITSGSTKESAKIIDDLYKSIIEAGTYLAPSIQIAEAAKIVENAQRDLNIAFVNELSLIFDRLNIPTHEVLKASSTKWNFMPFTPGLVGGHCISVDSHYLVHKAKNLDYHAKVINAGRVVNDEMPHFVAQKLLKLMIKNGIKILDCNVLILGITFKENCNDIRNSKTAMVVKELKDFGCNVEVSDPIADKEEVMREYAIKITNTLPQKKFDGIIITLAHDSYKQLDLEPYIHPKSVVFDLKCTIQKADARL